jgi:hypothetical protein
MDFYASLTINRCHFDRLCEMWTSRGCGTTFPFAHAIVSPLFARRGILERLHEQRGNCKVMFDSGGFHIQQDRIGLSSASHRLGCVYREHGWADRFVLPDVPLTSQDSRAVAKRKLDSTRRQYSTFPATLPDSVRKKLLPVVHGTTVDEVRLSAYAARNVGSVSLGFGGFSTSGPNAGVNSFTQKNVHLLTQFAALCSRWGIKSHVFGIGGPSAIAVLRYVPIDSFDSAGWIRTAAYGNAYLPYIGALNITGTARSRRCVTKHEFALLRKATGHMCPFCADESLIVDSWRDRALHNYCTISQATRELEKIKAEDALEELRRFNPRFARYLQLVIEERSRPAANRTNLGGAGAY